MRHARLPLIPGPFRFVPRGTGTEETPPLRSHETSVSRAAVAVVLLATLLSEAARSQTISVAVLRDPPTTASSIFWTNLQLSSSSLGSTPVAVDFTTFSAGFTSAGLLSFDPDVIVFAGTAAGPASFTTGEITAIQQFLAQPGKRAIGLGQVFGTVAQPNGPHAPLLPLFGLTPPGDVTPGVLMNDPQVAVLQPGHAIMGGLAPVIMSTDSQTAQIPADLAWDPGDYLGTALALTANRRGLIHYWQGSTHDAVYVSYRPDVSGNPVDQQLVYNAIVAGAGGPPQLTALAPARIGTALPLSVQAPTWIGAPFVVAFAASTQPGIPLAGGRVIPLNPDPIYDLSLAPQNGFVFNGQGVINGNGTSVVWTLLQIPYDPALLGLTIFGAMVTLDPSHPTGIGGISPALPITFVL